MSRHVMYNANPDGNRVGDCIIRAISAALGQSWDETYIGIAVQGFLMKDMPSGDHVWGAYLRSKGFERQAIPNECPDCYTVEDFCEDHPDGTYILAISSGGVGHAVYVNSGKFFDTWDCADEIPTYYWERKDDKR